VLKAWMFDPLFSKQCEYVLLTALNVVVDSSIGMLAPLAWISPVALPWSGLAAHARNPAAARWSVMSPQLLTKA
jgi:hypothetical protein